MKRPSLAAIREAIPLTKVRPIGAAPFSVCDLCHAPGGDCCDQFDAHRECDEWDRPIPGTEAIVLLGYEHRACERRLLDHPRLYLEERGEPGWFPKLCGPCMHRDGFACKHPDLKANGGPGLAVRIQDNSSMFICSRDDDGHRSCTRPTPEAWHCAGRRVLGEPDGYVGDEPAPSNVVRLPRAKRGGR